MKKFLHTSLALALASTTFMGCQRNTESGLQFEVGINKDRIPLRVLSGNLVFHSGSLTLESIKFEGDLQGKDGGEKEVSVEQVTTIDLATGNATPALPKVFVEAGTYKDAEMDVDLYEKNDTPPLIVMGDYTHSNNEVIPLRFEYDGDELFEAEADEITLDNAESAQAVLLLDPIFWFSTVPTNLLDNAVIGPDNVILISENSNSEIYELVVQRIQLNTDVNFF